MNYRPHTTDSDTHRLLSKHYQPRRLRRSHKHRRIGDRVHGQILDRWQAFRVSTEEMTWTLTDAAKDCRRKETDGYWSSVSRKTIQRALDAGKFPDAYRDDGHAGPGSGPWRIPKSNLIAEGFIPGGDRALDSDRSAPTPTAAAELDAMRAELAECRHRAEMAEAREQLLAENVTDLRNSLRMLEAQTSDNSQRRLEAKTTDSVDDGRGLFGRVGEAEAVDGALDLTDTATAPDVLAPTAPAASTVAHTTPTPAKPRKRLQRWSSGQ